MKKKKIVTLLSAFAVTIGLIGGTLAWLTFHDSLENHFSTGDGNKIHTTIVEHFNPDTAKNMKPGTKIQKQVAIKNTGKIPEFVRVKITPTWDNKDLESKSEAIKDVTLNYTDPLKDWIKGSDNWYYYTKILPVGETTSNLLESVNLNSNIDFTNKIKGTNLTYANQALTVNVVSNSVQTTTGAAEDVWNLNIKNLTDVKVINALKPLYTKPEAISAGDSVVTSTTKTDSSTAKTTTSGNTTTVK